jgi:hypothetical protein
MKFADYRKYDASGLAALVVKRQVSAKEVLETAIAPAEQVNPSINAIIHKQYEQDACPLNLWPFHFLYNGDAQVDVRGAPYQIRAVDLQSERVVRAMGRKGGPCHLELGNQIPMFTDT